MAQAVCGVQQPEVSTVSAADCCYLGTHRATYHLGSLHWLQRDPARLLLPQKDECNRTHLTSHVLVPSHHCWLHLVARRDHLLSSYAASVSKELSADAVKLNLDSPDDKTAQTAALERNASMLQRMKSLLNSRN